MGERTDHGLVYRRRPTRVVRVGDVELGGANPIRVQSMTTPPTRDTAATVRQILRLVEVGCEIVRVTVPTTSDADNLPDIRAELARHGARVPLVADIHFTPAAAMKAVEHVDKIRVNPGNYADKKKFAVKEYTDAEYAAELERIETVFAPLVRRSKELGVSMRIGTNHGSLSDRIMNRYGDTPEGMVESALEFVRICEAHGYRDLILSMKASNPVVVLQVYRLLARRMAAEGMDYPFHLGVTEAGEGEDGRIKSALGIGALLEEGMGDTVRVSLTEDPVAEIPVARALVEPYNRRPSAATRPEAPVELFAEAGRARRLAHEVRVGAHLVGGDHPVRVEVPLSAPLTDEAALQAELDGQCGVRVPEETRAEIVSVKLSSDDELEQLARFRGSLELVAPRVALSAEVDLDWLADADDDALDRWLGAAHRLHITTDDPSRAARPLDRARRAGAVLLVEATGADAETAVDRAVEIGRLAERQGHRDLILALDPSLLSPLRTVRLLAARLADAGLDTPLLLIDRPAERGAEPLLGPSAALGGLLCEGIGDAVQISCGDAHECRRSAFGLLQAARVRITRTEFISCPSCGRTLFDLEETTARIKARTAHLKGVKIAIMGCVVNGPGEMADADFGYVGWGEDKIALFVGKEMVAKDIPTRDADERLVELIRRHGKWVDPPVPLAEKA